MKNILLVEDTDHLAEEIADILRLEGYQITRANNAIHALEILDDACPNLIITDLLMPRMDGFELIQRVRSLPSFASTPIIILSAKTSSDDKLRGKEVGADAFIQKPCRLQELLASITALLEP